MTWKIKWPTGNGTAETLHDDRKKVAEIFDEAQQKGLSPWIEDHKGKRLKREDF